MHLGPRLVIPGTLFGAFFLALFLYAITGGVNLPPALAALEMPNPTAAPPVEQPAAEVVEAQPTPQAADVLAGIGSECQVSGRYPDSILQWCALITHYANQRGLHPDLVAALIWQESGGNPVAYSKSGAVGLMQVMPRDGLASAFMCKNGPCFTDRPSIAELQDPEFNVSYGTRMLADLFAKYGNLRDALKFYGPMDVGYYYADKVLGLFKTYGN